jgi:hypothetical protein
MRPGSARNREAVLQAATAVLARSKTGRRCARSPARPTREAPVAAVYQDQVQRLTTDAVAGGGLISSTCDASRSMRAATHSAARALSRSSADMARDPASRGVAYVSTSIE